MGQEGMGDMMVPTHPAAGFIVIQPYLTFGFFQGRFHWPAQPTHTDELGVRASRRCVAQIELELGFLAPLAAENGPHPRTGQSLPDGRDSQKGKVIDQRSLATFLDEIARSCCLGQVGGEFTQLPWFRGPARYSRLGPRATQHAAPGRFDRRGVQPDPGITRHFAQIPLA